MKISYLILAHDQPRHLRRLVQAVSGPDTGIYIHLDRKARTEKFDGIERAGVAFVPDRIAVYWGEFSQVEAIVALLAKALKAPERYDRFVLLSGNDYPLRAAEVIRDFFSRNRESEFIDLVRMPDEGRGKPLTRLSTYRALSGERFSRLTKSMIKKLGLPVRRSRDFSECLGELQPFGGATWWAITRTAALQVMDFFRRERRVVRFYRNTVCPDEMIFQTILGNSYLREFVRPSLTYADWSAGEDRPAWIEERHLPLFESRTEFLFARKFREDREDLVARVDALAGREAATGLFSEF